MDVATLKWILGVWGITLVVLDAFWNTCWVPWAAAWIYFRGQGVLLCAFGAQSSPKETPFAATPFLGDVGSQRVPKTCYKWT